MNKGRRKELGGSTFTPNGKERCAQLQYGSGMSNNSIDDKKKVDGMPAYLQPLLDILAAEGILDKSQVRFDQSAAKILSRVNYWKVSVHSQQARVIDADLTTPPSADAKHGRGQRLRKRRVDAARHRLEVRSSNSTSPAESQKSPARK